MSGLRRTPLFALHERLGARMVPFAGWSMPVQYTSIVAEHRAVREAAGLFDTSHMGQIHLSGPGAVQAAERLVSCPVASLRPGRVRYGLLCNEQGGVVDDVTVYRIDDARLFLCVNAANVEKDRAWLREHAPADVAVDDRSDATAMLALQGPQSDAVLTAVCTPPLETLRRFRFTTTEVAGVPAQVSRTGYTGAGGFELYLAAERAEGVAEALLDAGRARGLVPTGLGARDTLRLEAALPLYGHELDDATTPLEAGLERFVKLEQGGFLGAEALHRQAAEGVTRRLAGFRLRERGVARAGYALAHAGETVGSVTSGAPSPTLGVSIGLGWLPPSLATPGVEITVRIRDRAVAAEVVETPFVRSGSG